MAWHFAQTYMEEEASPDRSKRNRQRILTVEGTAGAISIRVVRMGSGREFKWQGSLKELIRRLEEKNE